MDKRTPCREVHVHLHFDDADLTPILNRLARLEDHMATMQEQLDTLTKNVSDFETLTTKLGDDVHAEITNLQDQISKLGAMSPQLQDSLDKLAAIGTKLQAVDAESVGAMTPPAPPPPAPPAPTPPVT